jgi:hypothetical protein
MLGAVKYQILLDGEVKVDTQGGPGNSVSEVLAAERGEHSVVLKISNTAGNGHKCAANVFVGEDDPMPVSNLQLSVDGNDVSLTWEAPTVGKNGGNFNTDTLVYDVVRNPGEVAVATGITDTEFTETIAATSLTKYSYSVTARSGELSSDPVESDSFILGDGYAIPYSEDFTDVKSFDDIFYTVVDANNDNSTWSLDTYGERAKYSYSSRNAADDWLFTAPLQLNEGYSYDLNYTFTTTSWSDGEIFGSFIGTAPDPEAMTTAIVDTKDFVKNTTFEEGGSFKISDSGTYYIGFHITTQANSYHAYLDNISVVVDNESRLNSINVKGLTVSTAKGEIIVNADNNTNLAIYAMDGITVANGNVCGTKSYPVSRGFYLVKANDKVYKLSVK